MRKRDGRQKEREGRRKKGTEEKRRGREKGAEEIKSLGYSNEGTLI